MSTQEYRVQLDLFSGPLDLLLYLVRRHEVNVLDLPISSITGQFLELLEVLEFIDVNLAADFIVTASALAEIKSRMVLPATTDDDEEPELEAGPENELVQQLLEYKKYKEAAFALEEQASRWQERFPRLSEERPRISKDPAADRIKEVELWDLVSALSRLMRTREVVSETNIRYDDTPIAVWGRRISERVLAQGRCSFSSFFEGEKLRSRIVGIFLAILELVRHHQYRAEQSAEFGEIWILPPLHSSGDPVTLDEAESPIEE